MPSFLISTVLAVAAAGGVPGATSSDELARVVSSVVADAALLSDHTAHAWAAAGAPVVVLGARLGPGCLPPAVLNERLYRAVADFNTVAIDANGIASSPDTGDTGQGRVVPPLPGSPGGAKAGEIQRCGCCWADDRFLERKNRLSARHTTVTPMKNATPNSREPYRAAKRREKKAPMKNGTRALTSMII